MIEFKPDVGVACANKGIFLRAAKKKEPFLIIFFNFIYLFIVFFIMHQTCINKKKIILIKSTSHALKKIFPVLFITAI